MNPNTIKSTYIPIIEANLRRAFAADPEQLAEPLGAVWERRALVFPAFGGVCRISPDSLTLDGQPQIGPLGVVISMYLSHAPRAALQITPWRTFGELPHSRPYVGAFTSHTETPLVAHVEQILARREMICSRLDGAVITGQLGGDLDLMLTPLPKIQLAYIFYRADEDFPASAKCLFANSAHRFMPVDGLADVGEYTSKAIIALLGH